MVCLLICISHIINYCSPCYNIDLAPILCHIVKLWGFGAEQDKHDLCSVWTIKLTGYWLLKMWCVLAKGRTREAMENG